MPTKIDFILGDCLKGMQEMAAESIDLVVTSPPYNLGIKYKTYKDKKNSQAFIQWCLDWASEVRRVMTDDASFFLNVAGSSKKPLLPHQLILALTEPSDGSEPLFILQNTFHWIKSISVQTRTGETISAGHFKPIQSPRYVNDCHEYVFHLTKTGSVPLDRKAAGVPYVYKSNISRWGHTEGEDKRCRGNNWFIPYETISSRDKDRPHPATFPVDLVKQCIRIHGKNEATRLLDPFNGIGSSAVAAHQMNIASYTGFDIDEDYLATSRERIEVEKNTPSELF